MNLDSRLRYSIRNCCGNSAFRARCLPRWNIGCYVLGAGKGDPLIKATLFRWANYDTVTGTVRTLANEVPSGLGQYANPVPANGNLPASLSVRKASWWGTVAPWPAIGPDVSGGPGPGGQAYNIPARVCYDQTSKTNGILNFNANNCYGGATTTPRPAPPTNLRIVR